MQALRSVFAVICLYLTCAGIASAQDREVLPNFDVPSLPAAEAVKKIASQTNRSVLFRTDTVTSVRTNAIAGRYSLQKALSLMFEGTSLSGGLTESGVIVIKQKESAPAQEREASVTQKKRKSNLLSGVSALFAGLFGFSAAADADTTSDATETKEMPSFEEIVVTASKREQSIIDVPVSIQALGETQLTTANIRDVQQVLEFVPGSGEDISTTVGQRRFQIRGIAQGAAGPTVGYYIGEAAYLGTGGNAPVGRVYDMQRVEVLRGPQGTLYGNGAMGGVIRYIPNAPNLTEFEGAVRGSYSFADGGEDGYYIDGFVSIPLVEDKLAIRAVGSYEEIGGYLEDSLGNENVNDAELSSYRVNVLFQPTEDLSIDLMYNHNKADQLAGTLISFNDPTNLVSSSSPGDFSNVAIDLFSLTLKYDFVGVSLSSNTAYSEADTDGLISLVLPFTSVASSSTSVQETWSNETRLSSNSDSAFKWLVGVFYSSTDADSFTENIWTPEIPPFFLNTSTEFTSTQESISFFGEASYELMDGKLIPLIGIRYFEEELGGSAAEGAGELDGAKFDKTTFRFNLSYQPDEDTSYYLNIAQGFRSGSFNSLNNCALHRSGGLPCEDVLDSDTLTSYEVGGKFSLSDDSLLLDVALYYQDWNDARFSAAFMGLFAAYGVGDVESYGIDLGLMYAPQSIPGLTFTGTANWNSTEFRNVLDLGDASALEGQRINFVPEWSFSMMANYVWSISDQLNGLINISYSHKDGQFGQFGTLAQKGDSRDLMRMRVGVNTEALGLYIYANNLLNESGQIYSQIPANGVALITQDYPRVIGIELETRF